MTQKNILNDNTTWGVEAGNIEDNFSELYLKKAEHGYTFSLRTLKDVEDEIKFGKTKNFGNLFDPEKVILNKIIDTDGNILSHLSYCISEMIPVEFGKTYQQYGYAYNIAIWNEDGTFSRRVGSWQITIEEGEAFFRISLPISKILDYSIYEGSANVKFAHKEQDIKFNSIIKDDYKVDVTSLNEIVRFGGEVISGTVGEKGCVIKLPCTLNKSGTIDFDFVCDFDPHKNGTSGQCLFKLKEPVSNFNSWLNFNPASPIKGNFFPDFQGTVSMYGLNMSSNARGLSAWHNNFCGEDCFSIQRVSNAVDGDSIRVTDTSVEIYNGETIIVSYDFATYPKVDDIIIAMQSDPLLSDFEIIAYESSNIMSSDLVKVDMAMAISREEWDAATDTGLGTYAIDSWPVYMPASGKRIKHRFRMTFEGDSKMVKMWIDGYPVRYITGNRAYHNGYLYLGGDENGENIFDGWITNLRVRREVVYEPMFVVIIAHLVSLDLDDTTQEGARASIGRMERGLRALKERGYEFVTHRQFIDYVLGTENPPQKCAYIIYDDTQFQHWKTERIRKLYQKYGFKAATAVITKHLGESPGDYPKADILKYIKMSRQIGWDWLSHTHNHWNQNNLHFSQVKADCDAVKTIMESEQLYTDALVQPQGSGPSFVRKYWNHNIYQVSFKYADSGMYYGGDRMALPRVHWDNYVDFDNFIESIEGKFY